MKLKSIMMGCAFAALFACKSRLPDSEVVARVNDQPITKKAFEEVVDRNVARYSSANHQLPPGIVARIQESVLKRMVDDEIVAQKCKNANITVADADVDAKFKEHKDRFRTDQAFQEYLKRSGNTEVNLKEDLRINMQRDKLIEQLSGPIATTDADVEKYYNENIAHFSEPEQVKARRIVFSVDASATPAQKKSAEKEAKKVRALAVKPKADFGALAKEHSKGPEAAKNGDLGWIIKGHMPDLDAITAKLKPGEVSDVVPVPVGYVIVQLEERKEARQRSLEEVKEQVRNTLTMRARNEKRQEVMRQLKGEAKVELLFKAAPNMPPAPAPAPGAPPPPAPPGAAGGGPAAAGGPPPAPPAPPAAGAGAPSPPPSAGGAPAEAAPAAPAHN